MSIHYVNFYPYKEVLKYDDGKLSFANDYSGDVLNRVNFTDELIHEGKEYPNEALAIVSKVGIYYKENGSIV